ncbi:MAG: substrate-binding domain-containing protein [Turicibacter sp.]|nr:substrate-binding domain-containing protein [Turicibacter sp.]
MRKTKDISIEEIAKMAEVSTATVSRVINNKNNVNPKTREKVMQIIKNSNYELNDRQKQSRQFLEDSKTIVILVPDFSNPFNAPVIDGVKRAAKNSDYLITVVLAKEESVDFSYYEEILTDIHVAGIVALSAFPSLEVALQVNEKWPLVMCSEHWGTPKISHVGIDDVKAAQQATNFLVTSGRRNIALINGTLNRKYARDREIGYRLAHQDAGLDINNDIVVHLSAISYSAALSHLVFLFENKPEIDAVFASSDIFAAAAIEAAKRSGKKVPEDIAVIGFDNIDLTIMVSPTITTIAQPSFEIGYHSCDILIESINYPQFEPKNITLFTDFIIREST